MADAGRRQIRGDEPLHSLPLDATMLASPAQSAMPEVAHGEAKVGQGVPVSRNSVVSEMPAHNGLQPRADFRHGVVHTSAGGPVIIYPRTVVPHSSTVLSWMSGRPRTSTRRLFFR